MVGFILDCGRGQFLCFGRIGMDKCESELAYLCPWTTSSSVSCQLMQLRVPVETSVRVLEAEVCRDIIYERVGLPWLLDADEPDVVAVNELLQLLRCGVKRRWRRSRPICVGLSFLACRSTNHFFCGATYDRGIRKGGSDDIMDRVDTGQAYID